jgi:hypothetical protein
MTITRHADNYDRPVPNGRAYVLRQRFRRLPLIGRCGLVQALEDGPLP